MFHKNIITAKEDQQQNEDLTESLSNSDIGAPGTPFAMMPTEITNDPILTGNELRFLLVLHEYSYTSGVCFAKTKTIAEKAAWTNEKNIKTMVTSLKKKGHLFAYQIYNAERKGSAHWYVTKTYWRKFHAWLLDRRKFKVAKQLEKYFSPNGVSADERMKALPGNKEKTITSQKMGPDHVPKNGTSLILPKVVVKKRNNIKKSVQRIDKGIDDQTSGSSPPPFLDNLRIELEKSFVNQEQIELGIEYLKCNEEKVMRADNPIGYVIKMVTKGWADDHVKRATAKRKERERIETDRIDRDELIAKHKKEARKLKLVAAKEMPGKLSISPSDYHVSISNGNGMNVLPYLDKYFMNHIEDIYKRYRLTRSRV